MHLYYCVVRFRIKGLLLVLTPCAACYRIYNVYASNFVCIIYQLQLTTATSVGIVITVVIAIIYMYAVCNIIY